MSQVKSLFGPAAEGDVGAHRPREIFLGDLGDSLLGVLAQRLAGIDLMTRDPNVHLASLLRCLARRLGPRRTPRQPALRERSVPTAG